jgi:hypothetical protein
MELNSYHSKVFQKNRMGGYKSLHVSVIIVFSLPHNCLFIRLCTFTRLGDLLSSDRWDVIFSIVIPHSLVQGRSS